MILSGGGRILWYQPRDGVVHDLNVQRYRGEPVLTYFHRAPAGPDRHEILDRHYREVARRRARQRLRARTRTSSS